MTLSLRFLNTIARLVNWGKHQEVLSHRSRTIRKITAQICELMATGGL